jgi:hypothetical protein
MAACGLFGTSWLGASEAARISRVATAFVARNFGVAADGTPPQRLITGWRRLGGDKFARRVPLLDPLFERRQRIDAGIGDARPIGLKAAMVHAGHHKESRKVLRRRDPTGFLGERFVEIDRELGGTSESA